MATTKPQNETDQAAGPSTPENLRFDNPWKAKVQLNKVATVNTVGLDGGPFVYPLLTVTVLDAGNTGATAGKKYLIHAYPETLIAELKRVKPQIGWEGTIDYQGERQTKSGRKVNVFEIESPDTAPTDWDDAPF